jgi:aryl-alcohol dehydrogenase-like predicted oxidoreductase
MALENRKLGRLGPALFPIGLGCMAMSDVYGPSDEAESIATIHAAIDGGINLLDTGDFYGMGHNEMLIAKALTRTKREQVFIQVKFGALRDPQGRFLGFDSRPAAVKTSLAYSLKRLNTDYIDLYQPARLDPNVPIEETIGAIVELVQAGYVRHVGLSEVGVETIRRADMAHPITELQIEYSLMSRGIEARILPAVRELGIGITAYGVLSRGLLSGKTASSMTSTDFRSHLPRWSGENEQRNLTMVGRLNEIAKEKGVTSSQLAMAWVLSRGKDIVPLAGSRTRAQLADLLGALEIELSAEDVARLEAAVPADAVAGTRYGEAQMVMLDSER